MTELTVQINDLAWWSWTDGDDNGEGGKHRLNGGEHTLVLEEHDPLFIKALRDAIAANVGVDLIEDGKKVPIRVTTEGEYRIVGKDVCLVCNADLKDSKCAECGWDHAAEELEIAAADVADLSAVLGGEAA